MLKKRINFIDEKKACWSCCGHSSNECIHKNICNVDNCDKVHHTPLHVAKANGVTYRTNVYDETKSNTSQSICLLQIMKISSVGQELSVLWDSGASISLITFKAANQLGLKGKGMNLSVFKVGGEVERLASFRYVLPLTDKYGNIIKM